MIAYLDESGAHGGPDDVFTVGGWVTWEHRWIRIEQVWNGLLGPRVFHMTDFENRKREFAAWPKDDRRRVKLVAALADCILGNEAFGTAHSIQLEPLKTIMCPADAHIHHVKRFAYGMLLVACLNDIMFMFRPPLRERVHVVCEELEGVEGFARRMFDWFQRHNDLEGRLRGISFRPKASARGLQAADMLAYEGYKHITNTMVKAEHRPVRKLFQALLAKERLAIAYALEPEIRNWQRLYTDLPPWPPQ